MTTIKPKRSGKYCVAGGPNGVSCKNSNSTEGISMHLFPAGSEADKEKAKTRALWVQFVRRHRLGFEATATSVLCSAHFHPSCFHTNVEIAGMVGIRRRLLPEAIPTIDVAGLPTGTATISARARRQVSDNRHSIHNHCHNLGASSAKLAIQLAYSDIYGALYRLVCSVSSHKFSECLMLLRHG